MPQDPIEKTLLSRVRLDGRVEVLRPLFWTRFSESWYNPICGAESGEALQWLVLCLCVRSEPVRSEQQSATAALPHPQAHQERTASLPGDPAADLWVGYIATGQYCNNGF